MDKLLEAIKALQTETNSKIEAAKKAAKDGDLEKAKTLLAEIEQAKTDLAAKQAEVETLKAIDGLESLEDEPGEGAEDETGAEAGADNGEGAEGETGAEAGTDNGEGAEGETGADNGEGAEAGAQGQRSGVEGENPEDEDENEGEFRSMPKKMKKILSPEQTEKLKAFETYIRTKGAETRSGFTSVDGQALIPEEIIYTPREQVETVVDLRKLVNRVPVKTASGKYPVLQSTDNVMVTVEELQANPELANPEFNNVNFDVDTYRGYIPVSQEALDDTEFDLAGLIKKHIDRLSLNTSNKEIATVMKSFTKKTVKNLDEIKALLNVTIDPAYNTVFVASQSFINAVDTMKDANGRYLLQGDITAASGLKLFGRQVIVLADKILGTAVGDKVAFIGDIEAAVSFFDRKQVSAKWVDNNIYGQLLAAFVRFDVEAADTSAGYYVTLDDAEVVAGG